MAGPIDCLSIRDMERLHYGVCDWQVAGSLSYSSKWNLGRVSIRAAVSWVRSVWRQQAEPRPRTTLPPTPTADPILVRQCSGWVPLGLSRCFSSTVYRLAAVAGDSRRQKQLARHRRRRRRRPTQRVSVHGVPPAHTGVGGSSIHLASLLPPNLSVIPPSPRHGRNALPSSRIGSQSAPGRLGRRYRSTVGR